MVTALAAPGALVSILSRKGDHDVISRASAPIRFLLIVSAGFLFGGALLIAITAPLAAFVTWLTWALIVVGSTFWLLLVGYRNCERLPA